MSNRKSYIIGMVSGILIAIIGVFGYQVYDESLGAAVTDTQAIGEEAHPKQPKSNKQSLDKKFTEINKLIDKHFIFEYEEKSLDDLDDEFLKVYVESLGDPYTTYMSTKEYADFNQDTKGSYAGLGISVIGDPAKERIVVISPFDGFPAADAGILPGDEIHKIEGKDYYSEDLSEAVEVMKGKPGTKVNVTFYRPSTEEEINKDIERKVIDVPTVSHEILDNNIGYLRINQFGEVTTKQFNEAYDGMINDGIESLVIDLRNNPGGRLDVVSKITDRLVPEGLITYMVNKAGDKQETKSDKEQIEIPLVVLVNEGSASASEVLTAAVQDTEVGTVVGQKTFGKGIVQRVFELGDGSAVKITFSEYFSPNGNEIHEVGVTPDVEVELPLELSTQIANLELEEDKQLYKAVEILLEEMEK